MKRRPVARVSGMRHLAAIVAFGVAVAATSAAQTAPQSTPSQTPASEASRPGASAPSQPPVPAAGQTASSARGTASTPAQSASEPRGMGVGAELSGTAYFVYPAVSLTANLRVPLGTSSLDLVPEAGLTYFFFPMTGMSGNFFIPLGLALTFDDIGVGFVAQNMLSVANILGEGITTIGLEGSIDLFRAGHSSLRIDATVAAGVVWNTKISPVVLFTVSPALGYEYTLGANAAPIPGKPLVTPPLGGENSVPPPPSKPQTGTTGAS